MIYYLSLQAAGIIAGVFLVLISLPGLLKPGLAAAAQKFPRSHLAGVFLLTICLVWTFCLGILCLLAAEPLLDAAFLRYEPSRLLVTVLAYLLVLAGLFWVAIPYVLRDQINWSTRSVFRWRFLHVIVLIYGCVILTFAFMRF